MTQMSPSTNEKQTHRQKGQTCGCWGDGWMGSLGLVSVTFQSIPPPHPPPWACQSLWRCGPQQTRKVMKEMGMPDHLTCPWRNLYASQEATVRTGHGTTDWFQIGKGVRQGCILLPCLFNFYAEYIVRNAGLNEARAGIKIAGRNIKNLRYTDDTTLMAESEELKSPLMKVKEEGEKVDLKFNIQKTKIMASGPIIEWQIDGETVEPVRDFIFWAPKSLQLVTAAMKLKDTCFLEGKLWPT